MNELVVPPAPHWYKSLIVACSPDNTLVYGSKNDIVIIKEKTHDGPAAVQCIYGAHTKHIVSVSINRKWKEPHSYVASLGEDNIIKIWNLENFQKKLSNKDHTEHKDSVIGAIFAGDDRVVSATSNGLVIVWNINTNDSKQFKDLFKTKTNLTCLSSCPHAGWLMAFGMNNGCVVVADLRRNGQVLYKLRGHYQAVVSLSWCPAPVNVFPSHPSNSVKNKSSETEVEKQIEDGMDSVEKEEQKEIKKDKVNPWINLVHADDTESTQEEDISATKVQDFLTECDTLKAKILGLESSVIENKKEKDCHNENLKCKKTEEVCENQEVKDEEEFIYKNGSEDKEENQTPLKSETLDPFERDIEKTDLHDNELSEISSSKTSEIRDHKEEELESSQELIVGRPLPVILDPAGDFLDDSPFNLSKNDGVLEAHESEKEEKETDEATAKESLGENSGIVNDEQSTKIQVIEEEPRTEYMLASSGKDKSIYIWRAGTDGRMQTFFYASKKAKRKEKNLSSWISVCWIAPGMLLTSSQKGEILLWPLPKPKQSDKQQRIVHLEHSSLVFNIVAPPKYMTAYNWRDKTELTMWSFGQDGKLVNFDIDASKIRFSFSTVTSLVTCFDSSSYLDPNRLAVGLRDGGIRVWDLSLPHKRIVNMQKYQPKFTHKVSAISWHPLKEMILGFGTEEGRVGFIDLYSKKTTLFPHYFRNQVYKVEWGPVNGDTSNLALYVVAEGKMAVYNMQKSNEDPTILDLPDNLYVHKFAWKPDFSLLLLNGKDGSLIILKTDLVAITTVYPTEKGLNHILWHPDAFTNKTDISQRCNWFAATTTKGVLIFDCTDIENNDSLSDRIIAVFEGHIRPPLALAWCPFEGNKIVSTAADGLAHVWDLTTKSIISTFVDSCFIHNPAVVWSPTDPDLIIMGDKVIRIWRVSENPPKNDDEFLTARKRQLAKAPKSDSEKQEIKIKVDIPSKPKTTSKSTIVPAFYVSNDENIFSQIETMKKILDGSQSLEASLGSCVDPFQIFGNKEQVTQLLNSNYHRMQKEGKHKSCELISLWKGNLGEYIQNAIDENRVTPMIITLAPMVSSRMWHESCLTYAKKLSEDANSDPLEASTYFLACHKVDEAINCLTTNNMFKEALALAKYRLPEGSDIIVSVTEKWATYCINTGNFENAAFCYLSIKQYENAAKILARRNHKELLEFAAELALKGSNKGLYESIKFKCTELANAELNGKIDDGISEVSCTMNAILKEDTAQEGKSETSSELEEESQSDDVRIEEPAGEKIDHDLKE